MKDKKLAKYLTVTFAITWTFWLIEAALVKVTSLNQSDFMAIILLLLGGFGPTIAACFCLPKGFSWKKLGHFITAHKKGSGWILLGFAILEISFFALVSHGINKSIPKFPLSIVTFLLTFIQTTLLFGGNEELGWRGIMQPILMKKLPRAIVPFVIGLIWVCWHLPLWFIEGNSHQAMSFLSFAAFGLALSYWLSALFELTGSVLWAMVFHGLTNTLLGFFDVTPSVRYWIGVGFLTFISGLIIQLSKGPKFLKDPSQDK